MKDWIKTAFFILCCMTCSFTFNSTTSTPKMTACWNEDDNLMRRANGWKEDIVSSLKQINIELEEMGQFPIRSFQKTSGFRQYFILLKSRRKLVAQLDMLQETFPPDDFLIKGPNNMTLLKEGVIAVKRVQGGHDAYHWVGTFKFLELSKIPPPFPL